MTAENYDADATGAMRQKLMSADEAYIYKIPTLKSSGGHRAEDWDLSAPLSTCNFIAERRGDVLVLEFLSNDKVFAQSTIDLSKPDRNTTAAYIEPVVDSSRYFVLKIQGQSERQQAMIGFGFRSRDEATDLRECLQHYERSIKREKEASGGMAVKSIPKLAEGEKIRVKTKGNRPKKSSGGGGGGGLLLKKPPPPAGGDSGQAETPTKESTGASSSGGGVGKIAISMEKVKLDDNADNTSAHEDSSNGAVYEGTEEQWENEFSLT